MIKGVEVKDLTSHRDERGFFREIIRKTDSFFAPGFGQLSHSLVNEGVIKAWHGHAEQFQWTYVLTGVLAVIIHDQRPDSPTYQEKYYLHLGDGRPEQIYSLPPGVVHGYKCLKGPAHVLYITSGVYDPGEEIRQEYNEREFNEL